LSTGEGEPIPTPLLLDAFGVSTSAYGASIARSPSLKIPGYAYAMHCEQK